MADETEDAASAAKKKKTVTVSFSGFTPTEEEKEEARESLTEIFGLDTDGVILSG